MSENPSEKTAISIVNEKTRRHSHQPKSVTQTPNNSNKVKRVNSVQGDFQGKEIKRTNSLEKSKKTSSQSNLKKPSVPDIPETDQNEDDGSVTPRLGKTDQNLRISYTKNNRKVSNASRTSNNNRLSAAYTNEAYDHSNGSSIQGSMASLPVIREQYWCCKKWTRLEKILLGVVSVLALIIISLIITVSVMKGGRQPDKLDNWYNFKF